MKNISYVLSIALLLFFTQEAMTQGLGIRAGVNFQNITGDDFDGSDLDNDLITGFNAGLTGELPLAPDFFLQAGLLYVVKGGESVDDILGEEVTTELRLGYLEVPLSLVYKPMLGRGNIILGFGPYVAFGLNGTATTKSAAGEVEVDIEYKSEVGDDDPEEVFYIRRLDSGANVFLGYEFAGGLSFQLNAQLGLIDISPDYIGINDNPKWNNTGFGLSLGYRFASE